MKYTCIFLVVLICLAFASASNLEFDDRNLEAKRNLVNDDINDRNLSEDSSILTVALSSLLLFFLYWYWNLYEKNIVIFTFLILRKHLLYKLSLYYKFNIISYIITTTIVKEHIKYIFYTFLFILLLFTLKTNYFK